MIEALDGLDELEDRAAKRSSPGNSDFNPGWHTALDLKNLLTVSEAITRAAIERKESRGGQFREDYPDKRSGICEVQLSRSKRGRRRDGSLEHAAAGNAGRVESR